MTQCFTDLGCVAHWDFSLERSCWDVLLLDDSTSLQSALDRHSHLLVACLSRVPCVLDLCHLHRRSHITAAYNTLCRPVSSLQRLRCNHRQSRPPPVIDIRNHGNCDRIQHLESGFSLPRPRRRTRTLHHLPHTTQRPVHARPSLQEMPPPCHALDLEERRVDRLPRNH